jgi:phosphonate transport system substrate-binding protein
VLRFALPPSLGLDHLVSSTQLLREALSDLLATTVDVTVSQSYEALARNLLSNAVDAAHAPPFICAQVEPRGVTIAARAVRHGRAMYGSAFLRKKGSGISFMNPKQIRAAWVDPQSVAGYLLPVAYLKTQRRIDPSRHFASEKFYNDYAAAAKAVLDGEADLCAVHAQKGKKETITEALSVHAPGRADEFELIEMTDDVPGDAIAVAKKEDAPAVQKAFLHLANEKLGQRLLKELFHAERFEAAPPMGYKALYAVAPKDM